MLAALASLVLLAAPGPLAALGPVSAGTVRVYLIRHGQALSNLQPPPSVAPHGLDHLTPLGEIGSFIGELKSTPPPQRFPPRLANASFTVVEARPDGTVALLFVNHVAPGMPSAAP